MIVDIPEPKFIEPLVPPSSSMVIPGPNVMVPVPVILQVVFRATSSIPVPLELMIVLPPLVLIDWLAVRKHVSPFKSNGVEEDDMLRPLPPLCAFRLILVPLESCRPPEVF